MKTKELNERLELHKKWLNNETDGIKLDLRHADLRHADLQGADLQYANLQGADLRHADLQGANLQGADLQGAYLQYANLQGADLRHADLRHADLQGANLQGADLQYADLQYANLQGADLDFSVLPIWCGGLNFKIDEKQAKQLMYHVINLMQYSKIKIPKSHKSLYKWLSDSHVVTQHDLPVLKEFEGGK